jgi:hypothetical protein
MSFSIEANGDAANMSPFVDFAIITKEKTFRVTILRNLDFNSTELFLFVFSFFSSNRMKKNKVILLYWSILFVDSSKNHSTLNPLNRN